MTPLEQYRPRNTEAVSRIAEAYVSSMERSEDVFLKDAVQQRREGLLSLITTGIEQGYILLEGPPLDDVGMSETIPIRCIFAPKYSKGEIFPVVSSEELAIARRDLRQSTHKEVGEVRDGPSPGEEEGESS